MIDREQLVAWANTLPDDFVKRAVRDAECKAIDNIDGDGDHHTVFYRTLSDRLGGIRSKGTPRKTRFDTDLTRFRRWSGRKLLPGSIASALEIKGATPATSLSKYTIRNRLRAIDKHQKVFRDKLIMLLESPVAAEGSALLSKSLCSRTPKTKTVYGK